LQRNNCQASAILDVVDPAPQQRPDLRTGCALPPRRRSCWGCYRLRWNLPSRDLVSREDVGHAEEVPAVLKEDVVMFPSWCP